MLGYAPHIAYPRVGRTLSASDPLLLSSPTAEPPCPAPAMSLKPPSPIATS